MIARVCDLDRAQRSFLLSNEGTRDSGQKQPARENVLVTSLPVTFKKLLSQLKGGMDAVVDSIFSNGAGGALFNFQVENNEKTSRRVLSI